MSQGIRVPIAGIFFILGTCELTRAQARLDSPAAAMKPSGKDQNALAESELQAGIELTRGGHFAEAIAHLLEAQGRVSNDYAAEFNLALCYVGTGQFQKGISVLIGLRGQGRENASVENLLAQAYAGDGQEGQAFEALRRATAFTPKNEKLYLFVAGAFLGREEPAQSLRVIELGLQHLPESARLHYERGYLLSMLDDFDGARMDFERAAQIAPGSEIGYLAKAQESLFGGNLAEAIRVARTATAQGKQDYQLLAILGEALIRVGASPGQVEFAEARDALEKSVAARPNYASSQIALGHVDLLDGRLKAAIEHLETGRRLSPQNLAVYSLLAAAYRKSGQPGQAEATLGILAKLNQEQAQRIRTAPGDSKPIPGASGASRGEQKPQAGERKPVSGPETGSRGFGRNAGKGPGDQAFALLYGQNLIGFQVRKFGQLTAGPLNFDFFDRAALAEAEMQPRVLCRLIAHAPFFLIVKNQVAGSDLHASSDGVAIRTRADEKKLEPVIGVAAIVAEKLRGLPIVANDDVQISVVIKIPDGRPAADARQ